MTYLTDNGLKVRFILDHSFIEEYLLVPIEGKDENLLHKIILSANTLNEMDYPNLLFTGKKVIKHAEDLLEGKTGEASVKRQLLSFLVRPEDDGNAEGVLLSVFRIASKVGFRNYLVTPRQETYEAILKKFKYPFEIKTPKDAYQLIVNYAKAKKIML